MSTRTQLYSIASMDKILESVGSGDEKLLKTICEMENGNDEYATTMLSSSPPSEEPGAWNYVVKDLAEHFGLELKFLKLDDWKHYHVWEIYLPMVEGKVSDECFKMLELLKGGRPLVGTSIDHDGCCFAWLTNEETKQLHEGLKQVSKSDIEGGDGIEMFHQELIDSFKIAVKADHAIFFAAH